jgi:hypothetical protein
VYYSTNIFREETMQAFAAALLREIDLLQEL